MRGILALGASLLFASAVVAQVQQSELRKPSDFDGITDQKARSVALFEEMTKVITSPRCINCHPRDDHPRQGDDMHLHRPAVVRGVDDTGAPGLHCDTCHGQEQTAFVGSPGSIPGHEGWRLAPLSMAWIGFTHKEICEELKDPKRNGNRSLADIVNHHLTEPLVASSWQHGDVNRTPLPADHATFGALTRAWVDSGAACPD
jgi:hypothetical protein